MSDSAAAGAPEAAKPPAAPASASGAEAAAATKAATGAAFDALVEKRESNYAKKHGGAAAAAGADGSERSEATFDDGASGSVWSRVILPKDSGATGAGSGEAPVKAAVPSNIDALTTVVRATAVAVKAGGERGPMETVEAVKGQEVAEATEALLSLPSAPSFSLRKILEEADASGTPDTVVVWFWWVASSATHAHLCECASRPITLLRPRKDYICLPMGMTVIQDMWEWACNSLGFEYWQAIWIPFRPGLDNAEQKRVFDHVVSSCATMPLDPVKTTGARPAVVLVPFRKRKYLVNKAEAAGLKVFGDATDKLPRKDVLHPHPDVSLGEDTPLQEYMLHPKSGEPLPIRVPRGFTCDTVEEFNAAYGAMKKAGLQVVLKPSWESSGKGIILDLKPEDAATYTWDHSKGDVCLEEFLDADRKKDGSLLLPVIHFVARSQFGDIVEQLIAGTTSYNGTVSPCRLADTVTGKVQAACALLADTLDAQGFWGVDFLIVKGEPVLIDLNTGRPNGGHVPKIFVSRFAPAQPFHFWKVKHTPEEATIGGIYGNLMERNLAFSKAQKRGIAIMHMFPGGVTSLLAVGRDQADLEAIREAFKAEKDKILCGVTDDE